MASDDDRLQTIDDRLQTIERALMTLLDGGETTMTWLERLPRIMEQVNAALRLAVTLRAVLIEKGLVTPEEVAAKGREINAAVEIRRLEDMLRHPEDPRGPELPS